MTFLPRSLVLITVLFGAAGLRAADESASATPEQYPLSTCVVSDEPLGSMGEAERYVHREPGKPDRVVYFCCGGCEDDFVKDPAKFLAKLDAAEQAAKSDGNKAAEERHPHGGSGDHAHH